MAGIYASAEVTIIAAGGNNADAGISGFAGISANRTIEERWYKFGTKLKVICPAFGFRSHEGKEALPSRYYNRGWTFQEQCFSKRRLIFDQNSLHWECKICSWSEDLVETNDVRSRSNDLWRWNEVLDAKCLSYLPLHILWHMADLYNSRELTYQEDALPAFVGLTSQLSRKSGFSWLCGLPESCLDAALLWQPGLGPMKRRISSGTSTLNSSLAILPSWSWLGWQGKVWWHVETGDYMKKSPFRPRINNGGYLAIIVTWFTASTPQGRNMRRVDAEDYRLGMRYVSANVAPPQRWTRHPHDGTAPKDIKYIGDIETRYWNLRASQGHDAGCYFTHDKVPEA